MWSGEACCERRAVFLCDSVRLLLTVLLLLLVRPPPCCRSVGAKSTEGER